MTTVTTTTTTTTLAAVATTYNDCMLISGWLEPHSR